MEVQSIWDKVYPLVCKAERPSRYINHEFVADGAAGAAGADAGAAEDAFTFCMIYPDTYELGQANQAIRILVNAVNKTEGWAAERAFLPAPDMVDALREAGLPAFSLETARPLASFDVLGITLPHELAATNILETLDLAGIALRAADRADSDPIVIAGGPCAYNPEPYAPFFDAFDIGEGEEMLPEGLTLVRQLRKAGASRAEILRALANLDGWYVPSLYRELSEEEAQKAGTWLQPIENGVPATVTKQIFEGFATSDPWEPCVVPFAEVVHDRLNVEVLRGCARGCRFCQAGMMYRPVRERSADAIVSAVERGLAATGYDEVSLTSLSTTDHSQIKEILERLNALLANTGTRVSIPSQRLDSFGVSMAGLVAGQKKGGLTFAPEAGTQRLRDVINKNVTEENLFSAVEAAFKEGWRRCKLYFMIGLPTETDEDIVGIARLLEETYERARAIVPAEERGSISISASIAVFVPKAQTPFQWDGQIPAEEALRRVNLLRSSLRRRAINISWHDPKTSFVEAIMSRSGRQAANLVESAWRKGARFDAWTEEFNEGAWREAAREIGFDIEAAAGRTFDPSYIMPWEHISCGVSRNWLVRERRLAEEAASTADCTFENCSACGVCFELAHMNEIQQDRGGSNE